MFAISPHSPLLLDSASVPQVDFEKDHAEAVSGGFITEYEGAEAITRKSLKNADRVSPVYRCAFVLRKVTASRPNSLHNLQTFLDKNDTEAGGVEPKGAIAHIERVLHLTKRTAKSSDDVTDKKSVTPA